MYNYLNLYLFYFLGLPVTHAWFTLNLSIVSSQRELVASKMWLATRILWYPDIYKDSLPMNTGIVINFILNIKHFSSVY